MSDYLFNYALLYSYLGGYGKGEDERSYEDR